MNDKTWNIHKVLTTEKRGQVVLSRLASCYVVPATMHKFFEAGWSSRERATVSLTFPGRYHWKEAATRKAMFIATGKRIDFLKAES